ncbi:2-hydroxychromene-2-carboxylate isomerase [Rhodoferax sp.]|uniref:2-hydroxychromene-2-carboxylate isomerase n=1 Tax=Rhodoferax sp. TaxID=50421 RepID=UPI0037851398
MKQITFFLDFISPYAYLAFETLPKALLGVSYTVSYQPVLFAGLLKHHGQLGPAEIPAKRDWMHRQVRWLAQRDGIPLQFPAQHPFNPLGLLRLAVASDPAGLPNRYVCETLFRHVWVGGADAASEERLHLLTELLAPARDPRSAEVKAQLQAHGAAAIAQGVFGVPTFVVDGQVFWGQDALPMLRSYIEGDAVQVASRP